MLRPCLTCGEPTSASRCKAHALRKAPNAQRGYGAEHRKAREAIARTMPAPCGYCGEMIAGRWDAAHVVDGDPSYGWMPAHPICNQRAKVR